MVGLMQIMIYMLAVYLVFKGVEIFQIAFMSSASRNTKIAGMLIGAVFLCVALVAGAGFSYWADTMAQSINERMNSLPRLP